MTGKEFLLTMVLPFMKNGKYNGFEIYVSLIDCKESRVDKTVYDQLINPNSEYMICLIDHRYPNLDMTIRSINYNKEMDKINSFLWRNFYNKVQKLYRTDKIEQFLV